VSIREIRGKKVPKTLGFLPGNGKEGHPSAESGSVRGVEQ